MIKIFFLSSYDDFIDPISIDALNVRLNANYAYFEYLQRFLGYRCKILKHFLLISLEKKISAF